MAGVEMSTNERIPMRARKQPCYFSAGTALRLFLLFESVLLSATSAYAQTNTIPDSLALPAFSALILDMSEPEGEFHTDNLTSNESAYLHPLPILLNLELSGGVYVGVGPEQNFAYIGALRPEMAFIVDIRRQNMLQHLLYKALFALSDTRADFLSKLLSKPLYEDLPFFSRMFRSAPSWVAAEREPSIEELIDYFDSVDPVESLYSDNLAQIRSLIGTYGIDASDDMMAIEHVYNEFYRRQLDIQYDLRGRDGKQLRQFPDLRDLLSAATIQGETAGFLASELSYRYVKDMQRRNLIVPVVGDFSGDRALRAIAEFVKMHEATISVFYTSNVEYYLIAWGYTGFSRFIDNVDRFPTEKNSVFVRSFENDSNPVMLSHPDRIGDHLFTTLVQPISSLLEDGSWRELRGNDLYRHIVTVGNLD